MGVPGHERTAMCVRQSIQCVADVLKAALEHVHGFFKAQSERGVEDVLRCRTVVDISPASPSQTLFEGSNHGHTGEHGLGVNLGDPLQLNVLQVTLGLDLPGGTLWNHSKLGLDFGQHDLEIEPALDDRFFLPNLPNLRAPKVFSIDRGISDVQRHLKSPQKVSWYMVLSESPGLVDAPLYAQLVKYWRSLS